MGAVVYVAFVARVHSCGEGQQQVSAAADPRLQAVALPLGAVTEGEQQVRDTGTCCRCYLRDPLLSVIECCCWYSLVS